MDASPGAAKEKQYSHIVGRLKRAGFVLVRHGGSHDIWENPQTGRRVPVGRHAGDIPKGTYFSILKDAGLGPDEDDD
jgi:predicted RNA binding protein YcfA (HicA-like mRNA interferase family)